MQRIAIVVFVTPRVFLLANLNGFDPQRDAVKPEDMISLDRWAVACALDAQKEIKDAYDNYQFIQ